MYGPACRARDRQEKLELCQSYPGVARKKRDIEPDIDMSSKNPEIDIKKRDAEEEVTKSLRVNPNITPPPNTVKDTLKELGIDEAVQDVIEQVYKVSALALKNARKKYCNDNDSKPILRTVDLHQQERNNTVVQGIIEVIANFTQSIVDNAVANLTKFCVESETIDVYQRSGCSWNDGSDRCRQSYRSTKSGAVKYSTQHRPVYIQSTNHRQVGQGRHIYDHMFRSGNDTDKVTTESEPSSVRRKRDTESKDAEEVKNNKNFSSVNKHDNENNEHNTHEKKQDREHSGKSDKQKDREDDKKESTDDREEKGVSSKEKDVKVKKGDNVVILRSGTTIPPLKVNWYEPMRRRGRRNR